MASGSPVYDALFAAAARRVPAESAHELAVRGMAGAGRLPGVRAGLRRLVAGFDPVLEVRALGLTFPGPLGVAAGLDKNLEWFGELGALGFGFVEVGTVTALPQPGNPRPRIHRLPNDRALLNSMGFPNRGAAAAAVRLSGRGSSPVVAVNVGRSKAAPDAVADYRASARALAPLADLLVLNVSSPNTPGLRRMQAVQTLRELVEGVRAELEGIGTRVPLLVKIAPDLEDGEVEAIGGAALELALDGIVAVNTTVAREGLVSGAGLTDRAGGVSGRPLKARSLAVLRRLRAVTEGRVVLVSVGGIEGAEDAWARICAGATLVQAYTAFVYGGPLWPGRVNRGLAERVGAAGLAGIGEAVGRDDVS